jgi:CreA protein
MCDPANGRRVGCSGAADSGWTGWLRAVFSRNSPLVRCGHPFRYPDGHSMNKIDTTSRPTQPRARRPIMAAGLLCLFASFAQADEVGCVTTAWKLIGANHKVCVYAFDDPKVPGVTCHVSQAKTGGVKGGLGLAEDPSQFSLACRQTGPIALPANLSDEETVFSESTSILFKSTHIVRLWDRKHNTLVYLGISRKIIEGAPANSVSSVPVMPWGGR